MMIEQIKVMMQFLKLEKYVIPAYGISFPRLDLAMIGHYRPNTTWRIHSNGSLSYEGNGYLGDNKIWAPTITIHNIVPISPHYDAFIARAFEYLLIDCKKLLSRHIVCSEMPYTATLLKNFHQLEFISL
jgi:hypothetical protein